MLFLGFLENFSILMFFVRCILWYLEMLFVSGAIMEFLSLQTYNEQVGCQVWLAKSMSGHMRFRSERNSKRKQSEFIYHYRLLSMNSNLYNPSCIYTWSFEVKCCWFVKELFKQLLRKRKHTSWRIMFETTKVFIFKIFTWNIFSIIPDFISQVTENCINPECCFEKQNKMD